MLNQTFSSPASGAFPTGTAPAPATTGQLPTVLGGQPQNNPLGGAGPQGGGTLSGGINNIFNILNQLKPHGTPFQNPSNYINQIMSHWKLSPAAAAEIQHATTASEHAGAASGMLGSGEQLQHVQDTTQAITSQDQMNYLNHILGIDRERMQSQAGKSGLDFAQGQFDQGMSQQEKQGIMNAIGSTGGAIYGGATGGGA